MARWQICNVLQLGTESRRLWRFSPGSDEVRLESQAKLPTGQPLPAGQIRKDWRALWQKKLNIAWLPEEFVFVRVLQLPAADPAELVPMVELQLEKLSSIPVAQTVWSMELVPGAPAGQQTVIVLIAERKAVEEFLGQLEGEGYLADRLDLPLLQRMMATPAHGDGAWIHFARADRGAVALVAWRVDGTLRHLNLLQFPALESAPQILVEQLTQHAWAGETEGWFTHHGTWHLLADPALSSLLEPALRAWVGGPVEVVAEPPVERVAALTAARSATSQANLIPAEYALRYRQRFVDGLWMRSLFAVAGLYVIGVIIYFAALQVLEYKNGRLSKQIKELQPSYTEALQVKERIRVLQEQVDLKFAALDCWKAVCETMPTELSLDDLNFSRGLTLSLVGKVGGDDQNKVTEFNTSLRKIEIEGQPLFDKDHFEAPTFSPQPGGGFRWTFKCDLKRGGME